MQALVATLLLSRGFVAGWATDAKVKTDNPPGVQYCVRMTPEIYNGLDLAVVAGTGSDGFTHLTLNVNGAQYLPSDGPFLYHIHKNRVSSATDCATAGGHLDPYGRGETPDCDSSSPETCQVGDLSGKHGDIQSLPGFSLTYADKYLSLKPGDESFLGDKSLVLHFFNLTSFACANWGPCLPSSPLQSGSAISAVSTSSGSSNPSLTTVTSILGSGLNGSTVTVTKTIGGDSPYQTSQDLTTVTSTFTSGPSSGVVVTVTKTVWRSSASPPSDTVTYTNGLLTTITSTQSAAITTTYVSTLPGPSLTTITSTYMTTTAVQLVTTYTSTISGSPAPESMTTVTSTASLPDFTTITSTMSSGGASGSTVTLTSTLSYTTVTSTTSDASGSTITTTYTTSADGGVLGFTLSLGNPLAATRTDSSSASTTTTTETQNLAGMPTARAARVGGALAVALAVAVV